MAFVCQRCGQPLDVDGNILDIDPVLLGKGELEQDKLLRPRTPPVLGGTMAMKDTAQQGFERRGAQASRPQDHKLNRNVTVSSSLLSDRSIRTAIGALGVQATSTMMSTQQVSTQASTYVGSYVEQSIFRRVKEKVAESPVPRPISMMHRSANQLKAQILSSSPSTSVPAHHHLHHQPMFQNMTRAASTSSLLDAVNVQPSYNRSSILNKSPPSSAAPTPISISSSSSFSSINSSLASSPTDPPLPEHSPTDTQAVPSSSPTSSKPRPSYLPGNPAMHMSLRYLRTSPKQTSASSSDSAALLSAMGAKNSQPSSNAIPMSSPADFAAARLFSIASEQAGIDLPVCLECTKVCLSEADDQLTLYEAQNASYGGFLQQLDRREQVWGSSSLADLVSEISRLEEEEKNIRKEFERLEEDTKSVEEEERLLVVEQNRLDEIESTYWSSLKNFQSQQSLFLDERKSVATQIEGTTHRLDRLKRTHILNDSFHIWHDGHFGTVNAFRLGRLPSQPVDWNEINAAWGLTTQLLSAMTKRLAVTAPGFKFSQYRLLPLGSQSKMERLDNGNTYELFGSSDISLGRLFWYRRFDNGMVAFLLCLKELADFAESQDKSLKLPYRMDKDKVGDMSIKIQFNNEETWTKSLKYMLTNLKWLLSWMAKREAIQMEKQQSTVS